MTSGHLIPDLQFTLLRYINFRHLNNTGRQFVPYSSIIFLTLHLSLDFLVFDDIIMQQIADHIIFLLIGRPFVRIHFQVVQILQILHCKLHSLAYDIFVQVILNPLRSLSVHQFKYFINQ